MGAVQVIYDVLAVDPGVASLVSTRITPLLRTQDLALPAVTIRRITTSPINTLNDDAGMDDNRVQVDSWASTYAIAYATAQACRRAITAAGFPMNLELDDFNQEAQLAGLYQVTQEYYVMILTD